MAANLRRAASCFALGAFFDVFFFGFVRPRLKHTLRIVPAGQQSLDPRETAGFAGFRAGDGCDCVAGFFALAGVYVPTPRRAAMTPAAALAAAVAVVATTFPTPGRAEPRSVAFPSFRGPFVTLEPMPGRAVFLSRFPATLIAGLTYGPTVAAMRADRPSHAAAPRAAAIKASAPS